MASVRKHGDKWQARIQRRDQLSISKSFLTKADALKRARNTEAQLDLGTFATKLAMPRLRSMVDRYVLEVTPMKKGAVQERYRAAQINKTKLADIYIDRIDGATIAKYRDQRLKEVSNNTLRLELAFLSVVFEQCRRKWGWAVANPIKQIRMPKPGKSRQRRLEPGEEEALLSACRSSGAYYLESFAAGSWFSGLDGEIGRNRRQQPTAKLKSTMGAGLK